MFYAPLFLSLIEDIKHLKLSDLSIEEAIALVSAIIGLLNIFLGLDSNITEKKTKLRFVLFSYLITASFIVLNVRSLYFSLLGISLFLLGGLSYLCQDSLELERELNSIDLLFLSTTATFCLTAQLFLFILIVIIIVCRTHFHNFAIPHQLCLTFIFGLVNYIYVIKDFFSFKCFRDTITKWNPYIEPNNISSIKDMKISDKTMDLLAMIVCFEDKDYLVRKSSNYFSITLLRRIFKTFFSKLKQLFDRFFNINISRIFSRKLYRVSLLRGYSTIEQQYIRVHSLRNYSYRCMFRRKLFIELIYTPLILKSIRKRKARVYSRNYFKRIKLAHSFIKDLKYSLLKAYYVDILNNPTNQTKLVSELAKQSGLPENIIIQRIENSKESCLFQKTIDKMKELDNCNTKF